MQHRHLGQGHAGLACCSTIQPIYSNILQSIKELQSNLSEVNTTGNTEMCLLSRGVVLERLISENIDLMGKIDMCLSREGVGLWRYQ